MGGPYNRLAQRWKALRGGRGDVRVREIACVNAPRTLLCAELGDHRSPVVAIAAGLHGDERAGPWALLELVESDALDPSYAYRLWPCLNPAGYDADTREDAGGVDLNRTFGRGGTSPEARTILTANRDRRFALSLDLHEDCDARGFYCYEYGDGALGAAVVAALDARGLAVDPLDESFATAGPLGDAQCKRQRGRILPDAAAEAVLIGGLSYSLALARRGAPHALTFETPGRSDWQTRVTMHAVAVRAAIACLPATERAR